MAASLAFVVLLGGVALADQIAVDGDVAAGVQGSISRTVAPGALVDVEADIVVTWSGGQHLAAGSAITFTNDAGPGGTNLPSGATVGTASGTVPNPWLSGGSFTLQSQVTFTAPATPGPYSYKVRWGSTHACGGSGNCLSGQPELLIALTVASADTTAPLINCSVPDQTTWYGSEVTVPCTAIDTGSGLADPSDASFSLTTSVGANAESATAQTDTRQVCDLASPSNCATAGPYTFMVDRKAPTNVSGGPDRAPDHGGWYNAPVDVVFTGTDGGSGVASCTSVTYSGPDGSDVTVGGSCVDAVGNTSDEVASSAFDYDATAPDVAVTGVSDGSTYVLGSVPAAGCSTTDATSGVAADATVAVLGGPVGSIVATCSGAMDDAGNAAADVSVTYQVIYDWTGFFQPVDNVGWNVAKAGQSIPVKFSLGGDQGLDVLKANSPKTTQIQCPGSSSAPDPIEEYVTGTANNGLVYDALAGQYVYVWKTPKASAGKCFEFHLGLKDDTTRTFRVQFTR